MNESVSASTAALDADFRMARECVEQGRSAEAETIYARILLSVPDDLEAMTFVGMHALQSEQPEQARRLLDRVVAVAPKSFFARIYLGRALEQVGDEHLALVQYFSAITMAQSQGRWLSPQTTAPVLRELVTYAMRYIDAGRKRLFQNVLAPLRGAHGMALDRVMYCLDVYLGDVPTVYPDPRQQPKFLYFPHLPTTPYFARDLFPWYAQLENHTDTIRAELLSILREEKGLEPFLKFNSVDEIPRYLAGSEQGAPTWDAFFFYRHGRRYDENCARCPQTMAILESLPTVNIRDHAPEICFSVLTPGTHILPHRGVTNTRTVTHLPLIVPEHCALRVGGEEHVWQEGRCITFDDTFEHEAWNRSDQTRVVLIIDSWNPHLTAVERLAVSDLIVAIGEFNRECGILDE